ncbi:GumC family protein [Spirosoma flavum]|uniref:GumC family protein n=1 Tax=Spirosoma flavum TaxID=2048557 RepID=A0ABW6AL71_9BACT
MTIQGLGRLLKQHLIWFILFPCLAAGTVYYFMRTETKVYKTKATLYTGFTSGYSLRSAQEGFQTDYSAVSNAFDNILTTLSSNQTLYYVGVNLLSEHLQLTKPTVNQLSATSLQTLQKAIPASLWQSLLRPGDPAFTRIRIDSLAKSQTDNPIRKLLLGSDSYYSADHIGKKLKANRRNASDMLDLEYEADDPAIAQQTLNLAIIELNERYTSLKRGETNPVVKYYETKAKDAKRLLDNSESKLRAFNVQHNVLNFEDELKTRSATREALVAEYNEEVMRNQGAKAAMNALNQRMTQGGSLLKINTALTDKQAELTAAEAQLINARTNAQPQSVLDRYQAKINQASEELKQIAQNYFAADNSAESVPKQKLVNEWLGKVLEFEESGARMGVVKKRLDDYQAESTTFTPLESEQRQLTRDMGVAEKEYLSLVQSLNQATTHRQDIAIDGSVSVLDPPAFPLSAQAPKRWLFSAIAAGAGLVIALLLAAVRFWTDKRINSLEQAEQWIGSPVTAVFPVVKKFSANSRASRAAVSMFEQVGNAINIDIENRRLPAHPPLITLFSMRSKQGKSWFAHGLARMYAESGEQVAYFYPRLTDTDKKFEQDGIVFFPYELHPTFMNVREPDDLIPREDTLPMSTFNKIILELPALVGSPIPLHLINRSAVSLMVLTVHTIWGRRDKQLFELYTKAAKHPVLIALNKVAGEDKDAPTLGDIEQGMVRTKRYAEPNMVVPNTSPSEKVLDPQPK